jgi:hypothetical protein
MQAIRPEGDTKTDVLSATRTSGLTVTVERTTEVMVLVGPEDGTVAVGDVAAAVAAGGWVTMTEVAGSDPVQAASRGAATATSRTWRSGVTFILAIRATASEVVRAA